MTYQRPNYTNAVLKLARRGVPPETIATEQLLDVEQVYSVLQSARRRGEDVPSFKNNCGRPKGSSLVKLDRNTAADLEAAAFRRGTTRPKLCAALIEAIVRDGLIDAVLDDKGSE